MEAETIIELKNVTKAFNKKPLLKDVNLSISQGQSIALVGSNGIGKSTLLKIIAKLSAVHNGSVTYHRDLSFCYVPEKFPTSNLTVTQYLELMGHIDGIQGKSLKRHIATFLEDFFMTHMTNTPLTYLSKGSLQKVGVIQALLKTPDVLLLDEPLSGQDARSQRVFIQRVKELIESGTTVIMSCHEPYLIHEISDTIIELKEQGLHVTQYEKRELLQEYVLVFVGGSELPELDVPVDKNDTQVKLYIHEDKVDDVIKRMMDHGWSLRRMDHETDD